MMMHRTIALSKERPNWHQDNLLTLKQPGADHKCNQVNEFSSIFMAILRLHLANVIACAQAILVAAACYY